MQVRRFIAGDLVITTKDIRAGMHEDGSHVCDAGLKGRVLEIEPKEWDGVHVLLETGMKWWFKPGQLRFRSN
jgi:hypothetical protein